MGEIINASKVLARNLKGRPKRRLENNTKMDVTKATVGALKLH
jgi:hypothetical protein